MRLSTPDCPETLPRCVAKGIFFSPFSHTIINHYSSLIIPFKLVGSGMGSVFFSFEEHSLRTALGPEGQPRARLGLERRARMCSVFCSGQVGVAISGIFFAALGLQPAPPSAMGNLQLDSKGPIAPYWDVFARRPASSSVDDTKLHTFLIPLIL